MLQLVNQVFPLDILQRESLEDQSLNDLLVELIVAVELVRGVGLKCIVNFNLYYLVVEILLLELVALFALNKYMREMLILTCEGCLERRMIALRSFWSI